MTHCTKPGCHSGIEGHWCPTPIERAERHDALLCHSCPTTVDDRARELGLNVYDTALPQDWADEFRQQTNVDPVGQFVWCYDEAGLFGQPVALTVAALNALTRFDAARKANHLSTDAATDD